MAQLLTRTWRRLATRTGAEDGLGVPMALMVGVIVFVLGLGWTQYGIHGQSISARERAREQALDAAEAGVNDAMSRLTVDDGYAGGTGALADVGTYDVTVEPIDPADPDDPRRLITATGYIPAGEDQEAVARRFEAEVELDSVDGFDFALFAAMGGVTGENHMTVNGDVYGASFVSLENNTDVVGSILTPGWVTTQGNTLVTGDIFADGDVTLDNSTTTVQGSVFSRGDVVVRAHVMGDVQAGGTVTVGNGGQVDGSVAEYSAPPPVRQETLPSFTWDPANYSPAAQSWSTTAAFRTDWYESATAGQPYGGHHRITDTVSLDLDKKWQMSADTTVVSDGPIVLSREIDNASGGPVDLVIVSLHADGITMTNSVTIPDSVRVLLFAPEGSVDFRNLKHFTGAVYGKSIEVDQNFTLTWRAPDSPGFSWIHASSVHHRVVLRVLRETTASGEG